MQSSTEQQQLIPFHPGSTDQCHTSYGIINPPSAYKLRLRDNMQGNTMTGSRAAETKGLSHFEKSKQY